MSGKTTIISKEALKILEENSSTSSSSTGAVKFTESLKAVLYAFLIGIVLILITSALTEGVRGEYGPLTLFQEMYQRNFGSKLKFTAMLSRMSYLVPLGLSLVVSFRMGIFNIGASGQSFAGGIFAFWLATEINIGSLGFLVTIAGGVLMGMSIALLISFLKNRFNVNEVIASIMFNWIVFYIIIQYVGDIDPVSTNIENNDLRFDFIYEIFAGKDSTLKVSQSLNLGVLLMIPLALVIWYMYSKTKWGFKQDLIGNNPKVGNYLGIKSKKEIYKTMALSGALAGFAGTVYLVGIDNGLTGFDQGFTDIPGATFDGIAIALVGYNSPIGIIFSSFLFSIFKADGLDGTIGTYHIIEIMMASMVIFIAMSNYRVKYGKRGGK